MTAIRVEDLPGGSREEFDEKKLTVAFKAGDQSAYGSIYARFESRVNHLCRRMLTDRDDAAEATQETFLRVYQSLGRFNGKYKLGAWITRIATNVCLDQLRARQRKPIDATPLEAIEMDPPAGVIEDGPEETLMRLSETRRVRRVLKQLPPMHCAAIVLRDFEGLSYGEIADILEITDCQVKALIHRARQNFKRSWTAGLASLFIPTRLVARIRRIDTPVRDQATGAAATHATEVATSAATLVGQCGAAVQACGQYMTDKAAAIFTAAVVGTAAAGGGIIAGAHESKPEPRPAASTQPAAGSPSGSNQNSAVSQGSGSSPQSAKQIPTGTSEAPPEETTDPVAQPDPVPSPTPTETTPGDSGGNAGDTPTDPKPTPTEPPPPPPEPQGFALSFATTMPAERGACSCLWATSVDSERVGVSNKGMTSLSQMLTGTATAAGTPSYGLKLSQRSHMGSDHAMEFQLYTEEGSYIYQASGSLTERSRTDWGGWVYTYAGNYRLGGRPTRNEAMPEQGGYTLQLTVSTSRATIVSERFSISP